MINATEYEWSILEEIIKPGSHPELYWGAAMSMTLEYWASMGAVSYTGKLLPKGQMIYDNYKGGKYDS